MGFLDQYGLYFMFLVVTFEYLNFPGFPAGVIFPPVGIWLKASGKGIVFPLLLSVGAGVLGSMILYAVGYTGGAKLLEKIYKKRPKLGATMEKYENKLKLHANSTVFFCKLIPVVRTLIGFPAGAIKMNVVNYILYSALGIAIWNGVLMISGYAFSHVFLS